MTDMTIDISSNQSRLVKDTCLYIATKFHDIIDDIVVIGGLVPTLLIDQERLPDEVERHAGTRDLDIGLNLALLEDGRYNSMIERLKEAGFLPDTNEKGNKTRQRWKIKDVTVDFLIPIPPDDKGDRIFHIEDDLAAFITPGLHLAFQDRERISIRGRTIMNEKASGYIWVCGPGAYIVLKALAFKERGYNKDAYDLYYTVRNYPGGIGEIVKRLSPLLDDPATKEAFSILQDRFIDPEGTGPKRAASFITGKDDEDIQADVTGFIGQLLEQWK